MPDLRRPCSDAASHADDAGRDLDPCCADRHELQVTTSEAFHGLTILVHFPMCTRPLHREQRTAWGHERQAPGREVGQSRHRAGRDELGVQLTPERLCLSAVKADGGSESEFVHCSGEPPHAALERLHEVDRQVGPRDGEHEAGQPGTAPYVDDASLGRDDLAEESAVDDVTVPEPRHLTRSDKSMIQTSSREDGRVALQQGQAIPDNVGDDRRGRGEP